MYLTNLLYDFGKKFPGFDVTVPDNKKIATYYLNLAYKEVYGAHDWEYRNRQGQIVLVPNYTTGTCSITKYNGSNEAAARTVTFSGATLTDSMKSRYFQPQKSSQWYRILYVDVTNNKVYLQTPVIDATASGQTFSIWQRFYYLPSEVDIVTGYRRGDTGHLDFKSRASLEDEVTDIAGTGSSNTFSPYGVDPFEDSYSTGSITILKDANLVTGNGTSWVGNVFAGDVLTSGTNVFRVKRVETDTRIILYNYAPTEVPAASTYSIVRDNPLGFQFYNNADDYKILNFTYLARGFDMVHETKDRPLLPERFDMAILTRAESLKRKDDKDAGWPQILQLYQAELDGLKLKRDVVNPRFFQFAPKIFEGMPGRY